MAECVFVNLSKVDGGVVPVSTDGRSICVVVAIPFSRPLVARALRLVLNFQGCFERQYSCVDPFCDVSVYGEQRFS